MRKLLLNVAPFRVYPPVAGAHHAVYYANEALSRYWDVFLFTTGFRKDTHRFLPQPEEIVINSQFREYSYTTPSIIPLSFLTRQGSGVPQIYAGKYLAWKAPKVLHEKAAECDIIQVELPWQVEYMHKINKANKPIVFVAHNIEAGVWDKINTNGLKKSHYKSWIVKEIKRQEKAAFQMADAVITVSDSDRREVIETFKVREERVFFIPWGVDEKKYRAYSEEERVRAKAGLGLSGKKIIVFSGTLYGPNIDAVRSILDMAKEINTVDAVFLIVGRVGEAFKDVSAGNILFTGFVNDPVKYFAASDIAINPMSSGGGMHLKMLEYLGSGLPVVTTEVGARGLRKPWEDYLFVSELKGFKEVLSSLLDDQDVCEQYGMRGRKVVEDSYTWDKVAKDRIKIYESLLNVEGLQET